MRYPDSRLSRAAEPRDDVDDALRGIGERLLAAAVAARAYGLAAQHIGEIASVVVVSGEDRAYRILYNPRVSTVSPETATGEEGSVSLPGARVDVVRPVWAEVEAMDADGVPRRLRLDGFEARVALHEIEQMRGMFFLERVSRLKRQMALKRARKTAG